MGVPPALAPHSFFCKSGDRAKAAATIKGFSLDYFPWTALMMSAAEPTPLLNM